MIEGKPGLLRIGIPTSMGTNGVRKEAIEIARNMLKEMCTEPIFQKWCKYGVLEKNKDNTIYYYYRWGMVLTTKVKNLEYATAIMESFDFDIACLDVLKDEYLYFKRKENN